MTKSIFVSDLHGKIEKYEKLIAYIAEHKPDILFIGGDLLPGGSGYYKKRINEQQHFISDYLIKIFSELNSELQSSYPEILIVMGNDDAKIDEPFFIEGEHKGVWKLIHQKKFVIGNYKIFGYPYVPPTPFLLKDWEKYDVSRYVDPGCISPEEGKRTVEVTKSDIKFATIQEDLKTLAAGESLDNSIFLFHSPPYKTNLDRAALDGKMIDHVPLDVHVGSIAIKKFIEENQPMLTMHGHIHESTKLTGQWRDKIGKTHCFNAAHQGSELSIIKFNLEALEKAERILL